jgi:UDP-N-acetyl-D-mannosaminuronic acid dehydrogenase
MSEVSIVGGAGHIGLPLSCFIQNKGLNVKIIDNNIQALDLLKSGQTTFYEEMLNENLRKAIKNGLSFSNDIQYIKNSKFVIVTIGTSSSKRSVALFNNLIDDVLDHIDKNSYLLLRSTI